MADPQNQQDQQPDTLGDIIRSIIPHIPAEKMAALLNHPHATDVIDAAGQAAAKAAGVDTITQPSNSTTVPIVAQLPQISPEDAARVKAINDAIQEQQRAIQLRDNPPAPPKDNFVDMLKGVGKVVTDQLVNGYNQAIGRGKY